MPARVSRIRDGLHFAAALSAGKVINFLLLRISFSLSRLCGRAIHLGAPASLSIEPTTACNLRCPECPSGLRKFSRPQGKIDLRTFKSAIDQLSNRLAYLMIYFQGEPLMHPGFFEMVNYARKQNIYTATSTNGHFLDKENARALIASGLDRIIISLDGTDSGTYEKYRRDGDFARVTAGIRTLVRLRRESGSNHPFIVLQFLVFRHNEHQIPDIRALARELGVDRLELKSAQVYDPEDKNELIPENSKYSRYVKDAGGRWKLKKPVRNRCFRMWSGAVMTWDGCVVPCCFDKDADHQMGTIEKQSFKEIWRSKPYKAFRQRILADRNQIGICKNCTE